MPINPWLVLRGVLLGSLVVVLVSFLATTGVSLAAQPNTMVQTTPDSPSSQVETTTMNDCRLSETYPEQVLRWCELITRHAESQGLPPDLIAALIWVESNGKPDAYSHSGAVGLMQVMPRDGISASFLCVNGPCFSNRPSTEELLDPDFNIQYGTRLLATLIQRHGNLREALRAYGPRDAGYTYADNVLSIYQRHAGE